MATGSIIIRPIISEQSMSEAEKGKFTFQVVKSADKADIKTVVENQFKVNVLGVQTAVVKGKRKRVGKRRNEVQVTSWKKAIVKLKDGQKIDLFDLAGGEEAK